MTTSKPYRRILLKLSGEGLMGPKEHGLDGDTMARLAGDLKAVRDEGIELCLVVGGGNIFRGLSGAATGMDRTSADHMGMLATVINALALKDALRAAGVEAVVQSGIPMPVVCDPFSQREAVAHLAAGKVVIFAAGTGSPYFTTDTAAALRAIETRCDVMMKSTQVDGVYDSDPKKNPAAKRYERLTYQKVLADDLKVMDAAAIALARENKLPILVFSQHETGSLVEAACGRGRFTVIEEG